MKDEMDEEEDVILRMIRLSHLDPFNDMDEEVQEDDEDIMIRLIPP